MIFSWVLTADSLPSKGSLTPAGLSRYTISRWRRTTHITSGRRNGGFGVLVHNSSFFSDYWHYLWHLLDRTPT